MKGLTILKTSLVRELTFNIKNLSILYGYIELKTGIIYFNY